MNMWVSGLCTGCAVHHALIGNVVAFLALMIVAALNFAAANPHLLRKD